MYKLRRGWTTAWWVWGKHGSAERSLLMHYIVSCRTEWHAEGCSFTLGISLRAWSCGLVLRQDQGITLNPPDRCHMHARAHKYTQKQKKNGGWEKEGVKKRDVNLRKKNMRLPTQSSGHCLYCCTSAHVQTAHMAHCHATFPTVHMGYPMSTAVYMNLWGKHVCWPSSITNDPTEGVGYVL